MTSMQRIGSVLSGVFPDRRPAAPVLCLYGARLSGIPLARHYRYPAAYAAGARAVADRFDPDILFGPFALAFEAEPYGVELKWTDASPPTVSKPISNQTKTPPRFIKIEDSEFLSFLVESVRLAAAEAHGEKPVAVPITAPIDLPALILGIDVWLELLLFEPEAAQAYLEFAEEHFASLAAAYFSAGAAFLVCPVMFANPAILTEALIEKLGLPALRRAFARAGGPVVFHHGAMPVADRLRLFAGLPNVAGFALDERDDSALARKTLGDGALLLGGPLGPSLRDRKADSVVASMRRLLRERAGDPRFIAVTTAADVPLDTPEATLDALLETVREDRF